ncbi:MAG: hypothetical protein AAGA83_06920 [Cyanobacteria bacterium P01_F01_bin.116]
MLLRLFEISLRQRPVFQSQPYRSSAVPTQAASVALSGWGKGLMACLVLKSLLWSAPALALPCLTSSMECLEMLTQQAIEQSSEIETINQQLDLTDQRQDYARNRQWTNYLTLDPLRLVQNVLGGGDVQRDRLDLGSLELREAELIRRREEVAEGIAQDVVDLVLDYEKLGRQADLIASQLETHRLRVTVRESAYRTGQGSTESMLSLWQRTEDLEARCQERLIGQAQVIRELEVLVDDEDLEAARISAFDGSGGCDRNRTSDPQPIPVSGRWFNTFV